MDKNALRKALLERRLAMPSDAWQIKSHALCQELERWVRSKGFDKIALFRSYRREPDLRPFEALWNKDQLFFPKTIDAQGLMEFFPYPADHQFIKGRWGLEEPPALGPALIPDAKTVIVVPALAYDLGGYRLGYGGGYYDRYFHRHPCSRIGVCFHDFLLKDLPSEAHDQRVSHVLTDRGIC